MSLVHVSIQGTSALLMHRFAESEEVGKSTRKMHRVELDPREDAERVAYRTPEGTLYMPAAAITRMLREAAGNHK